MLKAQISKTDHEALPADLQKEYVQKGDKYELSVEGFDSPSAVTDLKLKVSSFRDERTAALKERDDAKALAAKFDGIDPDEARTLKTDADALKKKGIGKADDLDAAIQKAVAAATKPLADKLAAEEQARVKAQQAADAGRFRELVGADATKAGVASKSLRHVLREAEEKFELKDGALVPKAGVKHPHDPLKELTTAEWLQDLAKSDDYLFEPSTGGGANPGNGNGGIKAGVRVLTNPTPTELGANMDDVASGKAVVVRT